MTIQVWSGGFVSPPRGSQDGSEARGLGDICVRIRSLREPHYDEDEETQSLSHSGDGSQSAAPAQGGYGQPQQVTQQQPWQGRQAPYQWQPLQAQPGYGPTPQWQGQQQSMDLSAFSRKHIRTPETKEFFKTSEFGAWLLGVAAVLVASAIDNGFDAFEAWALVTALTVGYMISRGLSKAGARKADPDRDGQ
jgi:hypothetical protein